MSDFLSMVVEMITKSFQEHGLFKTCYGIAVIAMMISMPIFVYKLADIILAITS